MADFGAETGDSFRTEVRDWLKANFPPTLKGKGGMMYQEAGLPPQGGGTAAPGRGPWARPAGASRPGPRPTAGGGLTPAGRRASPAAGDERRRGAWSPDRRHGRDDVWPDPARIRLRGPEARPTFRLIARGEIRWCQGFSEPGAGSDLASLQTKCEDKGDHWLVNGQKIWTSGAQWADWCFCLVRTDTTRKHEGISFLLIDMKAPGIEVRPIRLISGNSPFCETFFTDVKVPKDNLVGPLGGGWSIAKRLLQHERSGLSGGGAMAGRGGLFGGPVSKLALDYVGADEVGRIDDPDIRSRVAALEMEMRAFQLTAIRSMLEARSNQGPTAATSIMKNAGTRNAQERAELTLEILGNHGLGWEGEGFTAEELAAVRGWLGGKAFTIYGGSAEIQNNIIAKRILSLPDPLGSASN